MITQESAVSWVKENALLLTDLFDVRFAMEPAAARLAAIRARGEDLAGLEEAFGLFHEAAKNRDVNQLVLQDEAFHGGIVRSSHNLFFLKINELLTQEFRKYRQRSYRIAKSGFEAVEAHRDILNAIARRDAESATLHMTRHLEISMRDITEVATSESF